MRPHVEVEASVLFHRASRQSYLCARACNLLLLVSDTSSRSSCRLPTGNLGRSRSTSSFGDDPRFFLADVSSQITRLCRELFWYMDCASRSQSRLSGVTGGAAVQRCSLPGQFRCQCTQCRMKDGPVKRLHGGHTLPISIRPKSYPGGLGWAELKRRLARVGLADYRGQ